VFVFIRLFFGSIQCVDQNRAKMGSHFVGGNSKLGTSKIDRTWPLENVTNQRRMPAWKLPLLEMKIVEVELHKVTTQSRHSYIDRPIRL
jgi:hypothetical protein